MGDRPKARYTLSHHDADSPSLLTINADAVRRHVRLAAVQIRADDLKELHLIDRTPVQFIINRDVACNGG